MKESYITKNFKKTAAARFPVQAEQLNAAFYARLQALRQDNAGATKEKQRHLENQILPGIAAYEALQTVMPKDEALETIHSYVEQKARRQKKLFLRLMRIPGLYKKVPGIFSAQAPKLFGVTAGFASRDIQTTGGVWRIEMPVSRRQRALRLSGAVPLLLRQRRYHLRRPAPQALLAPHQDAWTRGRLLRFLPEAQRQIRRTEEAFMFWDNVAWLYDIFADGINRKANRALCAAVGELISPADDVLECACGTGLLTAVIAPRCKRLTATDFSAAMLRRAKKKCAKFGNVQLAQADILHLDYPDESFDAVVAANVIHLLDEPYRALQELERVCRPGGRLIIPTYMNRTDKGTTNRVSGAIGKAGADFKREFTPDTYRQFFAEAGYPDAEYTLCEGRIPCAVAVLQKREESV